MSSYARHATWLLHHGAPLTSATNVKRALREVTRKFPNVAQVTSAPTLAREVVELIEKAGVADDAGGGATLDRPSLASVQAMPGGTSSSARSRLTYMSQYRSAMNSTAVP